MTFSEWIPKKLGFFRNTPIFKESENSTEDASRAPYTENPNNYDKYVKDGNKERNTIQEFNSNNTELLTVEEVKEKLLTLSYIREELQKMEDK